MSIATPSKSPTILDATRGADAWIHGPKPAIVRHPIDSVGFATAMEKVKAKQTPEQQARGAAEEFVAMALVQPVLKSLRESNNTPPPFGPTDGEKKFGAVLDTEVAKRIVRATSFPLVDKVAAGLLERSRGVRAAQAEAGGSIHA